MASRMLGFSSSIPECPAQIALGLIPFLSRTYDYAAAGMFVLT